MDITTQINRALTGRPASRPWTVEGVNRRGEHFVTHYEERWEALDYAGEVRDAGGTDVRVRRTTPAETEARARRWGYR